MKLNIVGVALVAFALGCGSTRSSGGTGAQSDAYVDAGSPDSGHVIDESPPIVDAGTTPDLDSGTEERDSGHPPLDAAVGDDAGEDAGEEPLEDAGLAMCTGDLTTPTTFGTAQEPVVLAASDAPFEGQIDWRGRAFARITGVTPGEHYVITASVASDLILSAFTVDTTFKDAACVSGDQPVERDRLCLVTAATDSIDVAIDALHGSETFELTIAPAYDAEGTSAAPVQIAASALPYNLQTNSEVGNFYEITGLTAAVPYVVSAQASTDVVIVSAFQGTAFDASTPDVAAGYHPRAIATPQGTSLFVTVRAWGQGTTAVLDVRPATRQAQGTIGAPVQIAASALPFEGEVGWAYNRNLRAPRPPSRSFYAITGLAPGAYVVRVDGVTGPVRVSSYRDDSAYAYADSIGWVTADEAVTARTTTRIAGSILYLTIMNQGGDGTPFTLDLEPAPYTAVGEQTAPVELTAADLPYSSEVEPRVDSFYVITGLTPGQSYLARATDVTALPVGVMLFDDSQGPYTGAVCELQVQAGVSGSTCTVVPSRSTVHVRARAFGYTNDTDTGGVFTLSLEPIVEESVGTMAEPIAIECPAGSYSGRIGTNGYSYYEIVGLEPGAAYLVEATTNESDVILNLFSGEAAEPFYDPEHCNNNGGPGYHPARCVSTSASGSLFVELIGYARGESVEISVRPAVSGSEGTESAPVSLALAELPYTGQVSGAWPSFYAISGVELDTAYIARVAPVEEAIDVLLFEGLGGFAGELAGLGPAVPGAPVERVFVPTDTTVYLRYALAIGGDGLSAVEIDLVEAPHQSEGVAAPLPLALDEPHAGSVDAARVSRYELTGLTPGTRYIATLSNVSAQVSMALYEGDLGVLDSACTYDPATMSTPQCTFAPEGTAVRIEVRLSKATSTTFDLDVSLQE